MSAIPPLIVGNWKMNGRGADLAELVRLRDSLASRPSPGRVGVCPPFTLLSEAARRLEGSEVALGAQDCHAGTEGAFTGDVSAGMLTDIGVALVILGHSERRQGHHETDAEVAAKATSALSAGLEPILCVGETLDERRNGDAVAVVTRQAIASTPKDIGRGRFAIAYEPIWAIGSGLTPSEDEIAQMHRALRAALREHLGEPGGLAPILYGGSVKPQNAAELLDIDEVGGALVGGASLRADDFIQIIRAGQKG